jgi:hypothetical protein
MVERNRRLLAHCTPKPSSWNGMFSPNDKLNKSMNTNEGAMSKGWRSVLKSLVYSIVFPPTTVALTTYVAILGVKIVS